MPLLLILLLGLLTACTNTEPHDPNTVTVVLDEGPQNLDVRIGVDATSERLHQLLYVSLLKRSKEFKPEPDLALSWDIPDPRTYIFPLRDDAYFHNGKKITSREEAVDWMGEYPGFGEMRSYTDALGCSAVAFTWRVMPARIAGSPASRRWSSGRNQFQ